MKLRRKLITLQLAMVALLTTIIAVGVIAFVIKTLPLMEQGIETKTRACLHNLLRDVDVALAAGDKKLLQKALPRCNYGEQRDPDLAFITVIDAKQAVMAKLGELPQPALFGALPQEKGVRIERLPTGYRGVSLVSIEGMPLGAVIAEYSTARVEKWKQLVITFSLFAVGMILVSTLASVFFALHLIGPLRKMIAFVHRVAGGTLDDNLSVKASDELDELANDLNTMTRQLRIAQQQLADISRSAGMSEIASSILHNVGNVLNSVNVSADILGKKIKASKVPSVKKIAEMLAAHEDDLPTFFADDKRAKQLPKFVGTLADHLLGEQEALQAEITQLRDNIGHIRAIVAAQQKYAKGVEVLERVALQEVVESALKIDGAREDKRQVELIREFEDLPQARIARHKVMQVLVNLLSNAWDALRSSNTSDKKLRVVIRRVSEDRVAFDVIDNGDGIAEENQHRIFEHGFTTRSEGHGFGLHASANAATEVGGSLTVRSDGPGRGATFTLEVPAEFDRMKRRA